MNCLRQQIPHPHEVVRGGREAENPPDFEYAPVLRLTQHPYHLQPTEHFLNLFPVAFADLVAGMPRRSPIDRAAWRRMVLATSMIAGMRL
jgi:hypothetical protein